MSSFKDIQKKYKKLSKKYHADVNGNEEKMKEINKAYKILKEYVENYKFFFNEEEIIRQFPSEFIKKFRV